MEKTQFQTTNQYMAVCQNLVPLVNIKIAGKWMFIPLNMVLIGIAPYPYVALSVYLTSIHHVQAIQATKDLPPSSVGRSAGPRGSPPRAAANVLRRKGSPTFFRMGFIGWV